MQEVESGHIQSALPRNLFGANHGGKKLAAALPSHVYQLCILAVPGMPQNPESGYHNSSKTSSPHETEVPLGGRYMEQSHSQDLGKPKAKGETGHSNSCLSPGIAQVSLSHMLEPPQTSHSQHHILGSGSWNQSRSDYCQVLGKGNNQELFYFPHPTAIYMKFQSLRLVLLKAHLPAPGSWSSSFCSNATPRA